MGFLWVIAYWLEEHFIVAFILKMVAVAAISYAIGRLMMKTPGSWSNIGNNGQAVTVQWDTIAPHRWVYGRTRIAGVMAFANATGFTGTYLNTIQLLAAHEIEEVEEVYFNEELVHSGNPDVQQVGGKYTPSASIWVYTGSISQEPKQSMVERFQQWGNSHKLGGIAHIGVSLGYDRDIYSQGSPAVSAVVKGKKVLDPRTETVGWSDNPALCIMDVVHNLLGIDYSFIDTGSFIEAANVCDITIPKQLTLNVYSAAATTANKYIDLPSSDEETNLDSRIKVGMRITGSGLAENTYITATEEAYYQNDYDWKHGYAIEGGWYGNNRVYISEYPTANSTNAVFTVDEDEKQYTCNGSFTLDNNPESVLLEMLTSCRGRLVFANGKYRLIVGVWSDSVGTLDENDLREGMTISLNKSSKEDYNGIRGNYISPASFFLANSYPEVRSETYIAEDNGEEKYIEYNLTWTHSPSMAQRIAKQELLDQRLTTIVQYPAKFSAYRYEVGDTVAINNTRMGWTGGQFLFEVLEVKTDYTNYTVDLVLKRTTDEIYNWNATEETLNADIVKPNGGNINDVAPPTYPSASYTMNQQADGTYLTEAEFSWTMPTGSSNSTIIEYRKTGAATYTYIATVPATSRQTAVTVPINELDVEYEYRMRNFSSFGKYSPWVTNTVTINRDTTPPQAPFIVGSAGETINGTFYYIATSNKTSGSTTIAWNTWQESVDPDYAFTMLRIAATTASLLAAEPMKVVGAAYTYNDVDSGKFYITAQNYDKAQNASELQYGLFYHAGYATIVGPEGEPGTPGEPGADGDPGPQGNTQEDRYTRSLLAPATPTGDNPAGWTIAIPVDNGVPLWQSTATRTAAGAIVGTWTAPQRFGGIISVLDPVAPVNNVDVALIIGDTWVDINDNNRTYSWNGTAWVSITNVLIDQTTASLNNLTSSYGTFTSSYNITSASFAVKDATLSSSIVLVNNNLTSLSSSYTILSSSYKTDSGSFNSQIATVSGSVVTNSQSFAVQYTSLNTSYLSSSSSFASGIESTNASLSTTSSSLALRTTTLESSYTSNSSSMAARLTNDELAIVNNSSSFAIRSTSVEAKANETSASVVVNQQAFASLDGSVSASYTLALSAGNKITGYRIGTNGASSSFDILTDRFSVSSGSVTSTPFRVENGNTYIESALIKSLEAGKIVAGTITASIEIVSPKISGDGIQIQSYQGMTYKDDSGVFTITGGSGNGVQHGSQIDLAGTATAAVRGALVLAAGDPETSVGVGEGHISLRSGPRIWQSFTYINTERMKIAYDGLITTFGPLSCSGSISATGSATFAGGVKVQPKNASTANQSIVNQHFLDLALATTSGMGTSNTFDVDISGRGYTQAPQYVGICATPDPTSGFQYDRFNSSSTNVRIYCYKLDGSTLDNATHYITCHVIQYL